MVNLVHIINDEVRRQERFGIGFDLDGLFTDLHNEKIYNLVGNVILRKLPDDLQRALNGKKFSVLREDTDVPIGWYIDLERGFLVLPNSRGQIIKARRGRDTLPKKVVAKEYGGGIELPNTLDPDHKPHRIFPICDGFDYVQGIITAALAAAHGLPRKRTLSEIIKAVRSAHDDAQTGFKKSLLENPAEYGLKHNPELESFLRELKEKGYKVFLLTSSQEQYAENVLNILGIQNCFDRKITGITKPGCFREGHPHNIRLHTALASMDIPFPSNVLYGGDHLYKDVVYAGKFGFFTFLRMLNTDINKLEDKLKKYSQVRFKTSRNMRILEGAPSEKQLLQLSNFLYELYRNVHAVVTKVQYLKPILF